MNKNAASPVDFEQKIMSLVKNRKYLDFAKSHALSGGGLGALIGGGMGAAQTAAKQMRGDMTDEKGGDIMGQYLGSIGKGALTGGTLGAGAGALRGAGLRGKLRSSQLDEVKNALRGGAHPEALYNELISSGKLNPMSMEQYFQNKLPGRNKLTDMAAEHAYGGTPAKLPIETMAAREKAKEGIESFALSGNTQHLDAAGLGDLEKGLLIKKHREITAAGGNPLEHPEFNDIKERMLNAKHLVPAERPVPAGVERDTSPQLSHLDNAEAELLKKHNEHADQYIEGDRWQFEQTAHIGEKLENISKAKHHFREYEKLRETDFDLAKQHLRKSYAHMSKAGVLPPHKAPAPVAAPATSVESNVPESSRVLPGKTNISGEAAKDYTHTPVDMPEGYSTDAPADNKKRGIISHSKRRAAEMVKGVKDDVGELFESMRSGGKKENPGLQALKNRELAVKTEAMPAETYVREAKKPTRQMKPSEQAKGNKRQLVPEHIERDMPSYSEPKAEAQPKKQEQPTAPEKSKGFRKLIPEDVGQPVTPETKLPTTRQLSEEEKIDAAKKEIVQNKETPKLSPEPTRPLSIDDINAILSGMRTMK